MTPRTPDHGGVVARSGRSLSGLPQFIRYVSTYPDGADLLRTLKAGLLLHRGMVAGFLWSLADGDHLARVASIGWPRDVVERYAVMPLEIDLPAVHAVRDDRITIDDAEGFGELYLASIDDAFLRQHFANLHVASVVNVPLRHAGIVVGELGIITTQPWTDDHDSRSLLECLGALLGLWMSHPRGATSSTSSSLGQREWSLAFTPRQRQILRMAGEGMSNSDIARELLVSTSSVKQDLQQAMRALRSHDRATAFQRAVQLGLLD